jgi:AcrR family transcriptional regulator
MKKKLPADLDETLLRSAILVGGQNMAYVEFSTKKIAALSGVSEFIIFERFSSKEALLEKALHQVSDLMAAHLQSLTSQNLPLREVASSTLAFFLSHPSETLFLCNYSEATSRIRKNAHAYEEYHDFVLTHLSLLEPYFDWADPEEGFLIYSAFTRRLLFGAQFVLSHLIEDSLEYREDVVTLTLGGLLPYKKEASL